MCGIQAEQIKLKKERIHAPQLVQKSKFGEMALMRKQWLRHDRSYMMHYGIRASP